MAIPLCIISAEKERRSFLGSFSYESPIGKPPCLPYYDYSDTFGILGESPTSSSSSSSSLLLLFSCLKDAMSIYLCLVSCSHLYGRHSAALHRLYIRPYVVQSSSSQTWQD